MSEHNRVSPIAADLKVGMKRGKIVMADEAVRPVSSGDTVALDGLMGGGSPEELIVALEKRYLATGNPKGLTLLHEVPQGGISHLFRDIAARNPRTITRVGIGTYVDPRLDGGKINAPLPP